MNQTFQNSAQVLSIGIFFTLMIVGLAATLPHALTTGLEAHGVAAATAAARRRTCRPSRSCSPPSSATTRSSTCSARTRSRPCAPHDRAALTGPLVLPAPDLRPVPRGLHAAFAFAIAACLVAAAASLMRGGQYHDTGEEPGSS